MRRVEKAIYVGQFGLEVSPDPSIFNARVIFCHFFANDVWGEPRDIVVIVTIRKSIIKLERRRSLSRGRGFNKTRSTFNRVVHGIRLVQYIVVVGKWSSKSKLQVNSTPLLDDC